MKIMKDYHDLHLKVNALLLICYISTSCYRWDAMKKFNGIRLKLISDIDKYQFIESMTRGSISMIYKGHAETNNKFLKS